MRGRTWLALAVASAVTLTVATGTGTRAGWTSAQVADSPSTTATSRLAASHGWPGGTCSASGPADAACAGSPLPTGASSASTQTTADTFTDSTVGAAVGSASFTQQVQVLSCAPARFANTATAADPLLPRYGVTRRVTDRWGTTSAAAFDGVSQYAADVVATTTSAAVGTAFSLGLWFRAAAGSSGGGLLTINGSPLAASTGGSSPALYLDSAGRVRVRIDSVTVLLLTITVNLASPSGVDYRDGAWHQVTLTVAPALTTVLRLYVDGAEVASTSILEVLLGTSSQAWWHVAWADTSGLSGSPAAYFSGRIGGVFRIASTLSAAAVSALAASASASSYAAQLAGAQHLWMMGDDATSTHTTALSFVSGSGLPCSHVRLGWALGTTTAFALTPVDQLAGAGWSPGAPAAAPGSGASQTLTTSYARIASGYDADVSGLELTIALAHRLALAGSAWSLRFDWSTAGVIA